VTVDELVAFSNVFEVAVEDLITPEPIRTDRKLRHLVDSWWDARTAAAEADKALLAAETHLRAHLRKYPERWATLEKTLAGRAHNDIADIDVAEGLAIQLSLLLARSRASFSEEDQAFLDRLGTGRRD
jgi:hypothetical protein